MSAMRSTRGWMPKKDPWHPPDYDPAVIWAWRAFCQGKATESQQLTLFDYLMYVTGASEKFADLSFRPGDQYGTAFAEGKRSVGLSLRKLSRPELTPRGEHEVDVPAIAAMKAKRTRRKKA
jgi:hypothetical protein